MNDQNEYKLIDQYCRAMQTEEVSKTCSVALYRAIDHTNLINDVDYALPLEVLEKVQEDLRVWGRDYSKFNIKLAKYFCCYAYTINYPFGILLPVNQIGFEILIDSKYFD